MRFPNRNIQIIILNRNRNDFTNVKFKFSGAECHLLTRFLEQNSQVAIPKAETRFRIRMSKSLLLMHRQHAVGSLSWEKFTSFTSKLFWSIHISELIPPPLIGSHFLLMGGINWVFETAPQAKHFGGPAHPVYSPPYWVPFFINQFESIRGYVRKNRQTGRLYKCYEWHGPGNEGPLLGTLLYWEWTPTTGFVSLAWTQIGVHHNRGAKWL